VVVVVVVLEQRATPRGKTRYKPRSAGTVCRRRQALMPFF
jgi:hypothetical protein